MQMYVEGTLMTHSSSVYRRQTQLRASPDGTVPAFDLQRFGGIERVLSDAGSYRTAADNAIHRRRRRGLPTDAADANQGIRFRDVIDQGGIAAIGVARLLQNRHGAQGHLLAGLDGLHKVESVVA